jgi:LacI family transcriptional regulator
MRSRFNIAILLEMSRKSGRDILRGVTRYCRLYGEWHIRQAPAYYRVGSGDKTAALKAFDPDGIIFMDTKHLAEQIPLLEIPAIGVGIRKPISRVAKIIGNSQEIGQMAAMHFLERGFKNFAFCGFDNIHWSQNRCNAFVQFLERSGHSVDLYKQPRSRQHQSWNREMSYVIKWLKTLPYPIAIFCCNDERADNVIEACKEAQLKVPDEAAILGVDNEEVVCEIANPPISSIDLNFEKAGFEAAAMLDRWMRGENMANETIVFQPTRIIVRQSSNIFAIEDPDVARAVHFIRSHQNKFIQVPDVVKETTVAQRALQRKFNKILGHSINDEILSSRINYVCRMLVETNLSISQIVLKAGYSDINHISRCFKKIKGITPLAYRMKFGLPDRV